MIRKSRILLLIVAAVICLLIVGGIAIRNWILVRHTYDELKTYRMPLLEAASNLSIDIAETRTELLRYYSDYEPSAHRVTAGLTEIENGIRRMTGWTLSGSSRKLLGTLEERTHQFRKLLQDFEQLKQRHRTLEASLTGSRLAGAGTELGALSAQLYDSIDTAINQDNQHSREQLLLDNAVMSGISITIVLLLLVAILSRTQILASLVREQTHELKDRLSDLIRVKRALEASEARLRKAQAVGKIGSWEYDVPTGTVWGSEQAFEIYGLKRTSDTLPLDKIESFIGDASRTNQALMDLIEGNNNYDIEFTVHRAVDGKTVLLHSTAELVTTGGRPDKVVGVIQDITEKRQFEIQLQQAQRMESIGNLAGGIAHDFNNILFPIVGMAEMLMEDLPPDSRAHDNAAEIFKAGKRGSELIKQILAVSRQSEHEMSTIHVRTILDEALFLIRSTVPSSITIHEKIRDDCGPVTADSVQIHQVIVNLLTNACHAVQPGQGGEIEVRLSEVDVIRPGHKNLDLATGTYAMLTVSDNGCGIPSDIQKKIFDPYFTTKPKDKGTGLGLAVSYGIVRGHKGEITVESEVGKGAVFRVYLPVAHPAAASPALVGDTQEEQTGGTDSSLSTERPKNGMAPTESTPVTPPATDGGRILLVDDEPSVVTIEKMMLERMGYQVTAVSAGRDALGTFQDAPDRFDLLITDMTMPDITGDHLATAIHKIRPDLPVILCTGFSEAVIEKQHQDLGVDGILSKPVTFAHMAETVKTVLNRRSLNGHE